MGARRQILDRSQVNVCAHFGRLHASSKRVHKSSMNGLLALARQNGRDGTTSGPLVGGLARVCRNRTPMQQP